MTDPHLVGSESPTLSVLIPLRPGARVSLIVDSLRQQHNQSWELLIVGTVTATSDALRSLGYEDSRVRVVKTDHSDLAALLTEGQLHARGEFVLFAPRDAIFRRDVVSSLTKVAREHADVDVIYTDEDIERGRRIDSLLIRKPSFSPERLRCQFYLGDPVFYRATLLAELGGVRSSFPGAELYDLALRATTAARRVEHIAEVLFTLPAGSQRPGIFAQEALDSVASALREHLAATGGGTVEATNESGIHHTSRPVLGDPLVSIIIPTRGSYCAVRGDRRCLVVEAVRSIIEKSTYRNYEIVVVMDDVAGTDHIAEELAAIAGDVLRVVWWDRPFNFSSKVNFGAFHARGEFLLFLNDDVELISPGWLEALLSLAQRPNAGMVGAMLYFEDDTIQHAGHLYERGDAGHIGKGSPRWTPGPLGSYMVEREVSGVTAACSIMPRTAFERAGGFSILLPGNFNDVDLCLKVNELGYQIYWTPHAELYHYESKTRISRVSLYEVTTAWGRWSWKLDDPTFWPYGIHAE